jgi:hypothetical protein
MQEGKRPSTEREAEREKKREISLAIMVSFIDFDLILFKLIIGYSLISGKDTLIGYYFFSVP